MKNRALAFIVLGLCFLTACNQNTKTQLSDEEVWRLGWRMIASTMEENYELADLQFDSLRNISNKMDRKFLITGLEVKSKLNKTDAIAETLKLQDNAILQEICTKQYLAKMDPCLGFSQEEVVNQNLQKELISMYVDDQAVRGNVMHDLILKYKINTTQIIHHGLNDVDEKNRNKLKEIFKTYGFPTKKLVGRDAMNGVFLMIQHADRDKKWQKAQLENIEKAVENGDMDAQSYAYLFDRIQINNGQKQLYGTQFAKVDLENMVVELAPTEDLENLDQRRMEIGMMPIEMYKRFMLLDV